MFSFALAEKAGELHSVSVDKLEGAFSSSRLCWVDFEAPVLSDLAFVKKLVSLHPLTEDGILNVNKRAKFEEFEDYLFLVFHAVVFEGGKITPLEFDVILGKNFIFTFHNKPIKNIENVKSEVLKNLDVLRKGASFVLYLFLDSIVSDLFEVVDQISEHVDSVENEVFASAGDSRLLKKLFRLKRNVLIFRKVVSPQRDVMNFLYHHDSRFIEADKLVYFRDLHDSLVRVSEFIDTTRDMISDAFDAYLSVVSNKLNEIMKVLTIIATIILPMTLVTGFYGMNVHFLEYNYFGESGTQFFALFLILVIGLSMFFWFKKKKWV